ncbi:MAG: LysM domain-containing protein [Verrucomicrobiota bacterium JB022]|nr:LysM domain-containing protein [Verrucomicrobiota bacterium JB022]
MEDFDDKPLNPLTPDDEPEERAAEGGSKLLVVAMLLALGGLATGVAGIVMANQAGQEAKTLRAQIEALGNPSQELQTRFDDLDNRVVTLGSEIVKLGRTDRQLRDGMQAAIDGITRDIQEQRNTMGQLAGNMNTLNQGVSEMRTSGGSSRSTPSTSSTAGTSSTRPSPTTASGSSETATGSTGESTGGTYTVVAGDNYYRIARKTNTTVEQIAAANPGVDPTKLKVDQKLNLPVQ